MEGDIILTSSEKQPSRFVGFLKKWGIIIIDIIIVIIIATIFIIQSLKSSILEILVAPTFATVKINGETHSSNESFAVFPGTYNVEISADGFESKTFSFNIPENTIQKIYVYLTGQNDSFSPYDKLDFAETNVLRMLFDGSDPKLKDYLEKIDEYSDFISSMPYGYSDENGTLCSITIDSDNSKNLIVTKIYQCTPEVIESWIEQKGLDPDYFLITYQDLPKDNYDD